MIRMKPTPNQIAEEEEILNNPPHKQFGGCLPYPPDHCKARRPFVDDDGVEYVDMSVCGHCSAKCHRYHEHSKALEQWKKQASEIIQQRRIRKGKDNGSDKNKN